MECIERKKINRAHVYIYETLSEIGWIHGIFLCLFIYILIPIIFQAKIQDYPI